jgi:hypothetical protein
MTPGDLQLYLPLIVALAFIALFGRRMLRPRRVRVPRLWIGPALILVGVVLLLASKPAPSPVHGLALGVLLAAGAGIGWLRARLVRVEYDPAADVVSMRGTPYGVVLIVVLLVLRNGLRIATIEHPEWGWDLNRATDLLVVFAFGIVSGYAAELYRAAGRVRRVALPPP